MVHIVCLRLRQQPESARTEPRCPYTTLFRSVRAILSPPRLTVTVSMPFSVYVRQEPSRGWMSSGLSTPRCLLIISRDSAHTDHMLFRTRHAERTSPKDPVGSAHA